MKLYYFIPLFILTGLFFSAYGYNIGFTPVYQPPPPMLPYAQLSDSTTQSCPTVTPSNVTINTNDSIYLISHSTVTDNHLITIPQTGVYQIVAVPQVGEETPQANGEWYFWMMINGTQVANTNIEEHILPVTGLGQSTTSTLNWIGRLNANSTVSFQQLCTVNNIGLISTPAGTPPATPSIIITMSRI